MPVLPLLLSTALVTSPAPPLQEVCGEPSATTAAPVASPIARALALLGCPGQSVVLFDPLDYDDVHRAKVEQFEAFVFKERGDIYVNRRGRAYQDAVAEKPEGVYILAAILAHELAHLEGKDERHALEAERTCIYRFMKQGRVPADVALTHLRSAWNLRR